MKAGRVFWLGVMVAAFCFSIGGESFSADKKFPTKPIQVIIPFQPGETDNLLRPFLEKMPEFLGQPVTLVYKPGAAGSMGAAFVAASKPDGYTLLGSSSSATVILPLTRKDLGYTWESFNPVAGLADCPQLIAVLSSSPWKSLKELIADAKKNPGKLTYSCSGTFSFNHLMIESVSKWAGIKLTHIPSQGAGPAMTALLGGHINLASVGMAPAMPHIKAGTLRPLAIYNPKRIEALPDVPAMRELGCPLSNRAIFGLHAPKDTPRDVMEILYQAAKQSAEKYKDSINERLETLGSFIGFMWLDEYKNFLRHENEYFGGVLSELKKANPEVKQ